MAVCALASTVSAHLQWWAGYATFKPLTMLLAIAAVWHMADRARHPPSARWLLLGLVCSLIGDVCLLTDRAFIPGLVAFLCAHLAFIALLRRDRPWARTASGWAGMVVGMACGMVYAYLRQHGLPSAMHLPVGAYVFVIGAMAVQALARAAKLRTPGAWCVAVGAVSFMASDSILAINKFVAPVPASALWILGSYYVAQWLIVHGMLQALGRTPAHPPRLQAA